MDRSVLALLLVPCALALFSTPMGAALRPPDFPPSLDAFVEFQQGPTKDTVEVPASFSGATSIAAWGERMAEIFSWQMIEKSCLATAIYFESRSEPTLGQLAVANVIINRTKIPTYPPTICGVVFQGSNRINACQFSFACDGRSDTPRAGPAWQKATVIANLLLPVEKKRKYEEFLFVSTATHYHTIDVEPRWSKLLGRLNQIGRHMFYSQEA
jgi:spore germination cell wall hydrolase CwlJ-like protein